MKIKYPLDTPVTINEVKVTEINLDFSQITGQKLLSISNQLSNAAGTQAFMSPEALSAIGAEAAGMIPEDFSELKGPDFLEVMAIVQNFLLGTLHLTKYISTNKESENSQLN